MLLKCVPLTSNFYLLHPSVSGRGEGSERPAGGGKGQSRSRQPREGDEISGSLPSPAGKLTESRRCKNTRCASATVVINLHVCVCV